MLLPVLLFLLLVGVMSNIAQFGFLFTLKPLTPKLDKINPFSGLRRIFSLTTVFELVRSILKLIIAVVWSLTLL
ncbi:MAG: EscU/YscU/HrcU family type III secretion system export apparatus switch protein [Hydrogenothermaceae bacterium]|nr:EscU/YscU/HrcU family type III secretion system export apparatus switch protein [Hydrogenothermaceae bacterium]